MNTPSAMRRVWRWVGVVAVAIASLCATGCLEQRPDELRARQLVFGFSDPFATFDPARQRYANESAIIQNVLEPLLRWDENLELAPRLATHWETPDDCNTWILKLREGVVFHDGTAFDAHAVKAHFERIKDPATASTRASLIADIGSIEVIDTHTVALNMALPNCVIIERLPSTFLAIPSPTAVATYGTEIARRPVGTGPYMLESWNEASQTFRMRKFPDYWAADRIHIEELLIKQVREHTTRLVMLEQGSIDVAPVSSDHVPVAQQSRHINVATTPRLQIVYIGFNNMKPPFDDVRMRRAANYAVNVESIIEHVFFGVGVPARGPLPEALPAFDPDLVGYGHDPEKARQLIEEAGYGDGVTVQMWTHESGTYNKISQAVVEDLRRVGINVNLVILDSGVYWDRFLEYAPASREWYPTNDGVFDMFVGGWTGGESAQAFLEPLFESRSTSNSAFYENHDVNRLLQEVKAFADPEDRNRIYRQLQQMIVSDAPWIFTFYPQENLGYQPHVKNYRVSPTGLIHLEDVRLELAEGE